MARVRKKAVTVLVVSVVGLSALITAARMLEIKQQLQSNALQQVTPAQNRVVADVEAQLAANPAHPLAEVAHKLPLQFGGGYLLAYDNTGVLLTQTNPYGASLATSTAMIGALQSGQENVSYESWDGKDWCVRGLPIRAGGSLAGTVVFMTVAPDLSGTLPRAGIGQLRRTSSSVVLVTLLLIVIVGRFWPRALTHGRFALVRVHRRRHRHHHTETPANSSAAIEPPRTPKPIERQA